MERFDAIIVGGGPAGSLAAYRLARGGARVGIVDGSHPREKPCGGGITGRALEAARDAVDWRQIPAVEISAAVFEHGACSADVALGASSKGVGPRLAVISRRHYDGALFRAALEAGARSIPARATGVTREGRGWTVATREGPVGGDWLIGADGVNSLVRRRVSQPFGREALSIATGFFVHGTTSRDIVIAFHTSPAGYLWSFPRPDHLAVGACAQAHESTQAALLQLASHWIERNVPHRFEVERYSWPIPSLGVTALQREQPSGPAWMLVGDAAGMADPITREGIFFALIAADAAAQSLLAGSADPAARYAAMVRGSVYSELVRAARLKARFFNPRFADLMIEGMRRNPALRGVMADLVGGRQSYHGLRRRLLRTLDVRLMFDLLAMRSQ